MSDMTFNPTESEREIAERIISLYKTFKVKIGPCVFLARGERVTRFEFEVDPNEKVSKILKYTDDISLMLGVPPVRIICPIIGSNRIGIEVQNEIPEKVDFSEVFSSVIKSEAEDSLPLVLGRAPGGENIVEPLSKAPHLLIGGEELSGKTTLIKSMILSLMLSTNADDVKIVLITNSPDEFGAFEGQPHLFEGIVSDKNSAFSLLRDLREECLERIGIIKEAGVRSIKDYNERMPDSKLQKFVLIIDDFAEFFPFGKREFEECVLTLAQVGRPMGIHLILSTKETQPATVSGLIKANIPSRIALSCKTGSDSRTILDEGGAEKLLLRGDMLFLKLASNCPVRLQSPSLSDDEIKRLLKLK